MARFDVQLSEDSSQKLFSMFTEGKLEEALNYAKVLLQFHPKEPVLYDIIAAIWLRQNRPDIALINNEKALDLNPKHESSLFNRGVILSKLGQPQEALASYENVLLNNPKHMGALLNSANIFMGHNQSANALELYERVLNLDSQNFSAHANRGLALKRLGRLGEALKSYANALALNPEDANIHANKGLTHFALGQLDEAMTCYEAALSKDPNHINARLNKATTLDAQARYEDSIQELRQILDLAPDNATARSNLGHVLLTIGNFEEGWPAYEWRLRKQDYGLSLPDDRELWTGQDLTGKSILLLAEQGLGDQIQFSRYANALNQKGASVFLECNPKLIPLFKSGLSVTGFVEKGAPAPATDYFCPLPSVAGYLGEDLSTPHTTPYISADIDLIETWEKRLKAIEGIRIGANWQGNPDFARDKWRSFSLNHFSAIDDIDNVSLISLQKGEKGVRQISEFRHKYQIIDIDELKDEATDFSDAAAVIMNLDLVITSCTSIAHLAGALGIPTWVILGKAADWRWQLNRDDTPWYPNVRLFRQSEIGDWETVFRQVAEALKLEFEQSAPSRQPS